MSGISALQLISTGTQDIFLTVNPEINILQYVYYRYVNFSNYLSQISLGASASFGSDSFVIIPKYGHILSKIYLHLQLPPLTPTSGTYACYSDTLGYAIFDGPIELQIGGVVIDRLYPECMDMIDELSTSTTKIGHDHMILKGDMYRTTIFNATKPVDLMIPLNFWFCKKYPMGLPIISMTKQEIQINFKFKKFDDLINYDGITPPTPVKILAGNIYAEYLFLDESIIQQFKDQKHKYIITQTVYNGVDTIQQGLNIFNTKLNFRNPCQELIFACVDDTNNSNNCYFNYSRRTDNYPLISEIKLLMDGKNRFDINYLPEFLFRQFFPNNIHSVIPSKHMYIIPFALKPEDMDNGQPTGSSNFSRFDEITLSLRMTTLNPSCKLHVFGIMYNVCIIENGVLKLEWQN